MIHFLKFHNPFSNLPAHCVRRPIGKNGDFFFISRTRVNLFSQIFFQAFIVLRDFLRFSLFSMSCKKPVKGVHVGIIINSFAKPFPLQSGNNPAVGAAILQQGKEFQLFRSIEVHRLSRRIQESEPGQELLARITAKKNSSVGVAAPDFSGLTPEGKEVKLTDYRGKYVVIDFWGSWCHACRHSHPHMRELYEKYHSQGLEFIHIANEYQKKLEEKKEKWLAAIKEDQIGAFTHILNTADNDIVKVYNIQAFPTKILVSPTGEILGRWEGEAPELDRMLEKIFFK